eukprot:TRINITY_DN27166_c0_g1_i1.p1 TRINITY_DN27166_c0_g1~~TRINITY_DN27166_c0_g1_i1.p1  ORF type:complete len:745 (+),score=128.13 TRINITY_DN27166_c0_g1_i1:79-2313(+)
MAFQPVVEVAVHLGAIRNVCLARKGLYHIRCKLTSHDSKGQRLAVPHLFEETPAEILPAGVVVQTLPGPEGSSPERDSSATEARVFRSRTVSISYAEEEKELNDLACFRLELGDEEVELNLEVELMHLDMPVGRGQLTQDVSRRFVTLDSEVLRLTGFAAKDCLQIYKPVTFHEPNVCCVDLLVFATLLDYRLRARRSVMKRNGDTARSSLSRTLATLSHSSARGGGASGDGYSTELLADLTSAEASLVEVQKAASCGSHGSWGIRNPFRTPPSPEKGSSLARSSLAAWAAAADAGARQQDSAAEVALRMMLQELSAASLRVVGVWQELLSQVLQQRSEFTRMLRADWRRRLRKHCASQVLHADCDRPSNTRPADLAAHHERLAQEHRRRCAKPLLSENGGHEVVLLKVIAEKGPAGRHPVVFEQRCAKADTVDEFADWKPVSPGVWKMEATRFGYSRGPGVLDSPRSPSRQVSAKLVEKVGQHVLVLVHGFQGSSWDLQLFRNQLHVVFPDAQVFCAMANEDDSECDIRVQGTRLAKEVKAFLSRVKLSRLSFVAHSMGGVVVRAALAELMEYKSKLFTFMSLGSPHLGYGCASSSLFTTGLWITQQVKVWPSVQQLTLGDTEDLPKEAEPFLVELARVRCLEHFQHIVLVTSTQDQYTPFESARLEMPPASDGLGAEERRYASMLKDILGPIDPEQILRLDVNFHFDETTLDTFIGRAAHIELIENQSFFEILTHCYSYLFE